MHARLALKDSDAWGICLLPLGAAGPHAPLVRVLLLLAQIVRGYYRHSFDWPHHVAAVSNPALTTRCSLMISSAAR